jgi:hypothetical protein
LPLSDDPLSAVLLLSKSSRPASTSRHACRSSLAGVCRYALFAAAIDAEEAVRVNVARDLTGADAATDTGALTQPGGRIGVLTG